MLNMATEGPEGTEGKILRDSYLGGQSPELPHHQGGFAKSVCQRDGEMNAALQRKHNPSGTEAPVMSQVLGQLLYNDTPHSLPCSLLSTGEGASLREQSSSCRSTEPVPPRQTLDDLHRSQIDAIFARSQSVRGLPGVCCNCLGRTHGNGGAGE